MPEVPIWVSPNGTWYALNGLEANCTLDACPIETSIYGYRPSVPFSSTLIALFGLCMIVQIYLGFRWRNWGFMAAMILGCIDEIIGYTGRILYYNDPWGQVGFIMQVGKASPTSSLLQNSISNLSFQSSSPWAQSSSLQPSTCSSLKCQSQTLPHSQISPPPFPLKHSPPTQPN